MQQQKGCSSSAASTSSSLLSQPDSQSVGMTVNNCFDGSVHFGNSPSAAATPNVHNDAAVSAFDRAQMQTADLTQASSCVASKGTSAVMLQGHTAKLCSIGTAAATQQLQPHSIALHTEASSDTSSVESAEHTSSQGESQEEVMTLEELEARISSLNQTLLRAPTDSRSHSPPTFAMKPSSTRSRSPCSPRSRVHSRQHRAPHSDKPSSACGSHVLPYRQEHSACHDPAVNQESSAAPSRPMSPLSQAPSPRHMSALPARPTSPHSRQSRVAAGQCSSSRDQRSVLHQAEETGSSRPQQTKVAYLQRHGFSPSRQQALLTKSPSAAAALNRLCQQQSYRQRHDTQSGSQQHGDVGHSDSHVQRRAFSNQQQSLLAHDSAQCQLAMDRPADAAGHAAGLRGSADSTDDSVASGDESPPAQKVSCEIYRSFTTCQLCSK